METAKKAEIRISVEESPRQIAVQEPESGNHVILNLTNIMNEGRPVSGSSDSDYFVAEKYSEENKDFVSSDRCHDQEQGPNLDVIV